MFRAEFRGVSNAISERLQLASQLQRGELPVQVAEVNRAVITAEAARKLGCVGFAESCQSKVLPVAESMPKGFRRSSFNLRVGNDY